MKFDYKKASAYELICEEKIEDLASTGYLLRHKKTGARVVLLNNSDENKVFYIGFRTTPVDSTGVMHILEHSVLCGSERFPVKDPFIELAKGSLNTFLNAMTYPDKTVYPVASCNDKDFQNLLHVYMDAVFYPNSMKTDMTFRQEGWHYELEDADSELTINGVVYNEMKGAFSAPDDVLEREIFNSLFPDTTYGYESGGDPKDIPDLTYEHYCETYRQYYHPSNSYIYLYGDMDMVQKLDFIDREYLSKFEQIEIDSAVATQAPFDQVREVKKEYSITATEPTEDNSYLSYNTAMNNNLDKEEYIALQILDYALCTAPGAVLKQALLDAGIGKDVYSYCDNGVKQPYFSIVAKNANEGDKDRFVSVIEDTINKIVKEGFDKDTLLGGLNAFEFKYRESDFGSYPPGLMFGLQVLDSWLYDDNSPFIHIKAGDTFKALREKLDSGYFEELARKCILDNPHKSLVTVVPKVGLSDEEDNRLKEKLASYKASLSKEEIDRIVEETARLTAYQEEEEDPDNLKCIPVLEISDIKKETSELYNDERHIEDKLSLYHPIDTRGIDYIRIGFRANNLPKDCIPYLGIFKNMIGLMSTENYSYSELSNAINIRTGGISPAVNVYTNSKKLDEYMLSMEWKAKVLEGSVSDALELIKEIIFNTKYGDVKRNYELIAELKSKGQASAMNAGHHLAIEKCGSYFSSVAALNDTISGFGMYRLVERMEKDFDSFSQELSTKLEEIRDYLFTKNNVFFDFAGSEEEYKVFEKEGKALLEELPEAKACNDIFIPEVSVRNEGMMSSSMVNYVCRGGNYIQKGFSYTGSLRVLRVIMSYDYLWMNVRVKGGAYGCMCSFTKNGDSFFVSYRDPNLVKTIETYEGIEQYVTDFNVDSRSMTQYIIGAISEMDTPLTPSAKATRSMGAYFTNVSKADYQKERDEVLSTDIDSIRALGKVIHGILEDNYLCVVGNEEMIKANKDRFMNLENLFLA